MANSVAARESADLTVKSHVERIRRFVHLFCTINARISLAAAVTATFYENQVTTGSDISECGQAAETFEKRQSYLYIEFAIGDLWIRLIQKLSIALAQLWAPFRGVTNGAHYYKQAHERIDRRRYSDEMHQTVLLAHYVWDAVTCQRNGPVYLRLVIGQDEYKTISEFVSMILAVGRTTDDYLYIRIMS